jgi:hypothetical protein
MPAKGPARGVKVMDQKEGGYFPLILKTSGLTSDIS